jgi:hypothetical protein
MNGLDALLKTTLIGTEKLPLAVEALPIAITDAIVTKTADAYELVLRTTAMLFFYNNAGAVPQKVVSNDFEKLVESKVYASATLLQLLQTIETTGYYEKEYLYNLWLDKLIERNEIVNATFIMPLINAGINFHKNTNTKIVQVIGETGKLIIPLKPDFKWKGFTLEDVWKEGSSKDRKLFLEELLQNDVVAALELIEKDWTLESISFKKSILDLVIAYTNAAVYPFLEKLYNEEFIFTANEKPTVTQCRNLIAKALLFKEQSWLFEKTKAAITLYSEVAKKGIFEKLLSSSKKIKINLPTLNDTFFNVENVRAVFGIDPVNSNPAYFKNDILYWVAELLTILPITVWVQIFDATEKEVFAYFLNNGQFIATIHGQKEPIFFKAIQDNLEFSKNQTAIMLLLAMQQNSQNYSLAAYLTPTNFENFAMDNDLLLNANYIHQYSRENNDWSIVFSTKLINATYNEVVEKQQYLNDALRNVIIKFTNEKVISVLDNLFLKTNNTAFKDQWIEQLYKPLKKVLEIKQQIKQL